MARASNSPRTGRHWYIRCVLVHTVCLVGLLVVTFASKSQSLNQRAQKLYEHLAKSSFCLSTNPKTPLSLLSLASKPKKNYPLPLVKQIPVRDLIFPLRLSLPRHFCLVQIQKHLSLCFTCFQAKKNYPLQLVKQIPVYDLIFPLRLSLIPSLLSPLASLRAPPLAHTSLHCWRP